MLDEFEAMREALLMKSFHTTMNRACFVFADMSLTEYCLVCAVNEHPDGFSLKALRGELMTVDTLDYYEERLLSKELVLRVRDAKDHRALAFSITDKGKALVEHLDPELAMVVLERYPRATEAAFQRVAELMADFAQRMEPDAVAGTIFPAAMLKTLNAYHGIATTEAARMSVTFLQLGVLCLCGLNGGSAQIEDAAQRLEIPVSVFMHNLQGLENRGLICLPDGDRSIRLADAGLKRLHALLGRIAGRFSAVISAHHAEEPYAELKQYLLYLMD